jgi:hypothetical protein
MMPDHPNAGILTRIGSWQVREPILVWKRFLLIASCILLINGVDVRQSCVGCFLHAASVIVVFVSMLWRLANRNNFSAFLCGIVLLGSLCTRLPYYVFFAWRLPCMVIAVDADVGSAGLVNQVDYGSEVVFSHVSGNRYIFFVYEKILPDYDDSVPSTATPAGFWGGRHVRKNAIHVWGPWLMLIE